MNMNDASTPGIGTTTVKRGFGAMTPERQREIASQGGRAAQSKSNPRRFTSETASIAAKAGAARRKQQATATTTT